MPNKVELSATELATLDLLIAQKREDRDVINGVTTVTIVGAHNLTDNSTKSIINIAKKASLEELLALRNNAILKQKP